MEWLEPWHLININKQDLFNIELRKELCPEHKLFSAELNAIAKSEANDDVLYAFTDGTFRVADIHLTWKQRTEIFPYPVSAVYCSLEKWKTFVLYEDILPLIDHSSTVCVMGYYLMDHCDYEDYFKWAESLIEQYIQLPEVDILLGYSLEENIDHFKLIDCVKQIFIKLNFNVDDVTQTLYLFMSYLCDRVIENVCELDNVVRIFNKLYELYAEKFELLDCWKKLKIDLHNIYTYEKPVYFQDLSLENDQIFAKQFAENFKERILFLKVE